VSIWKTPIQIVSKVDKHDTVMYKTNLDPPYKADRVCAIKYRHDTHVVPFLLSMQRVLRVNITRHGISKRLTWQSLT